MDVPEVNGTETLARGKSHATVGVAYPGLNISRSGTSKIRSYPRIPARTATSSTSFEISLAHWNARRGVLSRIAEDVFR